MKILIATGIYPPDIGGPAQYARNLYDTWRAQGHDVKVAAYRWERAAPPGLRHLLYFTKIIRKGWNADVILVLDTWSAAVPTVLACALMRKSYILRTGGDALWESYVERTGDLVKFGDFYGTRLAKLTAKERLIFRYGGLALRRAQTVIFSSDWQRRVFEKAYKLDHARTAIVENFYGAHEEPAVPEKRNFLVGSRAIKLKNLDMVRKAFDDAQAEIGARGLAPIELDTSRAMYGNFVEKIRNAYAVIVGSISEMSSNMVADAIRLGTPVIATRELGTKDRVKDAVIFIDPYDRRDIASRIVWLSDPANRALQAGKVRAFDFIHSWSDIAREILQIAAGGRRSSS